MMKTLLAPRKIDDRRLILAVILGVIALALVGGGLWLALLGGSLYYVISGLLVGGSAWFTAVGDRRALGLYAAMLGFTVLWSLWETGLNIWGLQARLVAPAVLAIWVFWPWRRQAPLLYPAICVAFVVAVVGGMFSAGRIDTMMADFNPAAAAVPGGRLDWLHYGNDQGGTRFSAADQITPANVSKLKQAWSYNTGVLKTGLGFEATPLMAGNTLYLCTPNNIIIALDPDTGQRRWVFDPKTNFPPAGACRGVAYNKAADASVPCGERIVFGTVDARLMAVDARTGKLCQDFGDKGQVDLRKGMGTVNHGYYYVSSAPAIVRGAVVLGGWVADGQYVGEPSGVVRAFDVTTGKFLWAWDMDRPNDHGEPPAGKYYSAGTANSWGPMSGDEALGLVYLPTGNATPDYWGAHRSAGSEKYSSSVVALDAKTGDVRWSFQTSHHDLWDYDVSSQPTLIDLPIDGAMVPALVQATKRGEVFLLDRRTGKTLAAVEERKVPQGAAAGDWLSPTQPFSTGLPAFDRTLISERNMWGATPIDQLWCRIKFRQARYDGPMTPPGVKPTITYPSYLGGINWGGVSVDPERKLMVVNYSRMANYTRMVPRAEADAEGVTVSKNGDAHVGGAVAQMGTPFALRTGPFLSPIDMPCTEPPFGKIAVVDLKTRKMIWQRTLGTSADSGPMGMRTFIPFPMGVPNTGGSMSTRSGLIFIGATQERAIRAFETTTGKKLWQAALPAGGHAAPMTYVSPKTGRQYVVIAAGGNASLYSGAGDAVVAFALP